jgi:hypothetical protein
VIALGFRKPNDEYLKGFAYVNAQALQVRAVLRTTNGSA